LLQKYGFWKVSQDYINSIGNQVDEMFRKREAKQLEYEEQLLQQQDIL
jgi:hypothetical protein